MDVNGNRWDYHGNQDSTGSGEAAAFDKNSAKVSGMVERFDAVNTKTGTPMIRFALRCWRERIQIVAFKELATSTMLRPGERVAGEGRIQGTQWSAPDGTRRTGFQIVAPHHSPGTNGQHTTAEDFGGAFPKGRRLRYGRQTTALARRGQHVEQRPARRHGLPGRAVLSGGAPLAPCPFCGGPAAVEVADGYGCAVFCPHCHEAGGGVLWRGGDIAEAATVWNRRAGHEGEQERSSLDGGIGAACQGG